MAACVDEYVCPFTNMESLLKIEDDFQLFDPWESSFFPPLEHTSCDFDATDLSSMIALDEAAFHLDTDSERGTLSENAPSTPQTTAESEGCISPKSITLSPPTRNIGLPSPPPSPATHVDASNTHQRQSKTYPCSLCTRISKTPVQGRLVFTE